MKDLYERLKEYEPFFGTYLLDGKLGEGGFGAVYRLRHQFNPNSKSVVKIITIPDDNMYRLIKRSGDMNKVNELVERCCREIELLELFRAHSNIVNIDNYMVKEVDEIRRDILIQMEYLTDLHRYMDSHKMDEKEIVRMGVDICAALEEIQAHKIIHRDIKPGNIFISPRGSFKLGDFGIARDVAGKTEVTGTGTPPYMSPEIYNRVTIDDGDKKVDMYSLGLMLYELLNDGYLPFTDRMGYNDATTMRLTGKEAIPPIKNCDKFLNDIILKSCAYRREDRYDNVTQMKRDLQAFLDGAKPEAPVKPEPFVLVMPPKSGSVGPGISITSDTPPYISRGRDFFADSNDRDFVELLERAMQNNPVAQNDLGYRYYMGAGVTKNLEKAIYWLTKAAEQGHAGAQSNLGNRYYFGEGVEKSYEKAVYWFNRAAMQGNAIAQYLLGNRYYLGEGAPKDFSRALYWFTKSAELGYSEGQNRLGVLYYNGEGVAKNYNTAFHWYAKAANQGHPNAQNGLGCCYYYGLGATKNLMTAAYWFSKSAEQGYAVGQNSLGYCFYYGTGVAQDYEKAAYWFAKSAEQGNADSQEMLKKIRGE